MLSDEVNMSSSMNMSAANMTQSNSIKTALKSILENVTNMEEESHGNNQTISMTTEILTQVNTLYQEVSTSHLSLGESYLDSQVLCATSRLVIRCAESASGNLNEYDRHELSKHISLNPDFWEWKFPLEAPVVTYVHGTFAPTPPELRPRAPRPRRLRQAAAALTVPDNIANVDKDAGVTKMVNKVHKFVKNACKEGPLCYFTVALDPTSFSKSIENIYHLSFLAKTGLLEVFIDGQTGLPYIKSRPQEEQKKDIEDHFIVSIDMKLWKELIKALGIKKPMMVIKQN